MPKKKKPFTGNLEDNYNPPESTKRPETTNPAKDNHYVMRCHNEECNSVEFYARYDHALQCTDSLCNAIYRWSETFQDWILSDEVSDTERKTRYRINRADKKFDEEYASEVEDIEDQTNGEDEDDKDEDDDDLEPSGGDGKGKGPKKPVKSK